MEGMDMSPLPEDVQLPSGWVCKRIDADELVFAHGTGGLEVEAACIDGTQPLPFELTQCWEVTCRLRARESASECSIGRVTTRAAAVEALRSCMEQANRLVRRDGSTDTLTPSAIAGGVDLRGEVPSPTSSHDSTHRTVLRH
jgi:hypothetical protein